MSFGAVARGEGERGREKRSPPSDATFPLNKQGDNKLGRGGMRKRRENGRRLPRTHARTNAVGEKEKGEK